MDEKVADFYLAILFGSLKQQIIEIEYLYFYTISITSHENMDEKAADFCLAILFGSSNQQIIEI